MKLSRHNAPVVVVLGRRGSGKTTLVKSWLPGLRRLLVVDPNHEYKGGTVCTRVGALYEAAREADTFQLVYRPPVGIPDDDELARVDLVAAVALDVGRCLLVIDEADRYVKHGRDTLPHVAQAINQGRHRGVGMVTVARRPSRLPKDVIENASALYLFHLHEPHSLRYLAGIIGADVERLRGLGPGEYAAWDERRGVEFRRVALPSRK